MYKSHEVKKDIDWVGALDFDLKIFDIVMYTESGTTYNSYILKGSEKTAIFEVSKESFFDEFLERIKSTLDPAKIDYIILNHTEPDHSGSIVKLLPHCPSAKVVCTQPALKFLREIVNKDFDHILVKDGDTISLGDKTLKFITAPFLHWPDTMYTYVQESKTLFTCDSFGSHYCDERIFNDKIDVNFDEQYKYYFDSIMGPFKNYVLLALDKIKNLEIDTICPGHGPVLRKDLEKYINLYRTWSTVQQPESKSVVIAYASAYGYTEKMAYKIKEGIESSGDINVHIFDLTHAKKEDVLEKLSDANGLLIGSCTILSDTVPPVHSILSALNPVIHKGKIAGVFGSYGWSGEACKNISQRFTQLRLEQPIPSLKINFNPSNSQLDESYNFGKSFGVELLKQ